MRKLQELYALQHRLKEQSFKSREFLRTLDGSKEYTVADITGFGDKITAIVPEFDGACKNPLNNSDSLTHIPSPPSVINFLCFVVTVNLDLLHRTLHEDLSDAKEKLKPKILKATKALNEGLDFDLDPNFDPFADQTKPKIWETKLYNTFDAMSFTLSSGQGVDESLICAETAAFENVGAHEHILATVVVGKTLLTPHGEVEVRARCSNCLTLHQNKATHLLDDRLGLVPTDQLSETTEHLYLPKVTFDFETMHWTRMGKRTVQSIPSVEELDHALSAESRSNCREELTGEFLIEQYRRTAVFDSTLTFVFSVLFLMRLF